jgi:hypothetical protein
MKNEINIKTYLIEEELKYQITGVNTQQELIDLETYTNKLYSSVTGLSFS